MKCYFKVQEICTTLTNIVLILLLTFVSHMIKHITSAMNSYLLLLNASVEKFQERDFKINSDVWYFCEVGWGNNSSISLLYIYMVDN